MTLDVTAGTRTNRLSQSNCPTVLRPLAIKLVKRASRRGVTNFLRSMMRSDPCSFSSLLRRKVPANIIGTVHLLARGGKASCCSCIRNVVSSRGPVTLRIGCGSLRRGFRHKGTCPSLRGGRKGTLRVMGTTVRRYSGISVCRTPSSGGARINVFTYKYF